jgi:hypothetical protein
MIHKLQLPQAFGTSTIHGVIYEIMERQGSTSKKEVLMDCMKSFLTIPILFSLGFRTAKDLAFIAKETDKFVEWAQKTFDVTPNIMFV